MFDATIIRPCCQPLSSIPVTFDQLVPPHLRRWAFRWPSRRSSSLSLPSPQFSPSPPLPSPPLPSHLTGPSGGHQDAHLLGSLLGGGKLQEPERAHGGRAVQVHLAPQRRGHLLLRPQARPGGFSSGDGDEDSCCRWARRGGRLSCAQLSVSWATDKSGPAAVGVGLWHLLLTSPAGMVQWSLSACLPAPSHLRFSLLPGGMPTCPPPHTHPPTHQHRPTTLLLASWYAYLPLPFLPYCGPCVLPGGMS